MAIMLTTSKADFLANKLEAKEMSSINRKYFFSCFQNTILEVSALLPNYLTNEKIISVYSMFALIRGRLRV